VTNLQSGKVGSVLNTVLLIFGLALPSSLVTRREPSPELRNGAWGVLKRQMARTVTGPIRRLSTLRNLVAALRK